MPEPEPREALIRNLTRPFAQTKQRRGAGGKVFTYVDGTQVIQRLNSATDNEWSMSVTDITQKPMGDSTLWLARVALTIPGLGTREHIGVQMASDKGGEDLIKGCVTDALKKAATLFGVGIELYGEDYEDDAPPQPLPSRPAPTRERKPAPAREAAAEPPPQQEQPAAAADDPETRRRKWLNRLQGVCAHHGMTPIMLNRLAEETYNVPAGQMTEAQMTEVASVVGENPLGTWDYIAGLPHLRGIDHMRNARRPGATQSYPEGSNAAQAQAQQRTRQQPAPAAKPEGMSPAQNRKLWAIANNLATEYDTNAEELLHGQAAERYGVTSLTQLTKDQASNLIDAMEIGDIVDYVPVFRADPVQRQEMFGNGSH